MRGRLSLRRRGRPRQPGNVGGREATNNHSNSGSNSDSAATGYHDLSNVHTWVCAICKQYDPVLPPNVDAQDAANTEWIGCDCDRWYHQYCTGLKKIDDGFCCKMVNLQCLPNET